MNICGYALVILVFLISFERTVGIKMQLLSKSNLSKSQDPIYLSITDACVIGEILVAY